jgi:hypothetical protein
MVLERLAHDTCGKRRDVNGNADSRGRFVSPCRLFRSSKPGGRSPLPEIEELALAAHRRDAIHQ